MPYCYFLSYTICSTLLILFVKGIMLFFRESLLKTSQMISSLPKKNFFFAIMSAHSLHQIAY